MRARVVLTVLGRASVLLFCAGCDSGPATPPQGQQPATDVADPASTELPAGEEVGPVCPGCVSGGETSDFEGDTDDCVAFRLDTPVSDEVARELGFDVDRIRALVVREFASSLRWSRPTPIPGVYSDDPGEPPSGYSEETSIAGSLRLLGNWIHSQSDPRLCDSNGTCARPDGALEARCAPPSEGRLVFDVGIDLATADGAMRLEAVTRSNTIRSFESLSVSFGKDLSQVEGTLRVRPTRTGPYRGHMGGTLNLYTDQVRGSLSPTLRSETEAGEPEWRSTPLEAQWPDDGCGPGEFPIVGGTLEGAALAAFEERFRSGRARLLSFSPFVGKWEPFPITWSENAIPDKTNSIWVALEVAETARPLCRRQNDRLTFEVQARVISFDGRLDWTELMHGSIATTPATSDDPIGLVWSGVLGEDDPRWQSSFSGVDLLGGRGGRVEFVARTGISKLEIFTVTACEHDRNCRGPDDPWRTVQRAALLHWSPGAQ